MRVFVSFKSYYQLTPTFQPSKNYLSSLIIHFDIWPLHVILFNLNSTYGIELITYIFRISPKAQLLRAPRNQVVIMLRTRDFFHLRWASSLNQPSLVVGWLFYIFLILNFIRLCFLQIITINQAKTAYCCIKKMIRLIKLMTKQKNKYKKKLSPHNNFY